MAECWPALPEPPVKADNHLCELHVHSPQRRQPTQARGGAGPRGALISARSSSTTLTLPRSSCGHVREIVTHAHMRH